MSLEEPKLRRWLVARQYSVDVPVYARPPKPPLPHFQQRASF